MSEDELGKPVPDAVEQQRGVAEEGEELPEEETPAEIPFEVNEADVAEQYREVRLDEDDYR